MSTSRRTRALVGLAAVIATGTASTGPGSIGPMQTSLASASRAPLTLGPVETVDMFPAATDGRGAPFPVAAVDATGVVTSLWADAGVRAAQRDASGHWSPPVTLTTCPVAYPNCTEGSYGLAVDAGGTVTAAWLRLEFDGTSFRSHVEVSSLPRGGTWTDPQQLGPTYAGATSYPTLAVAADGTAMVAFVAAHGTTDARTFVATRAPGEPWSAARWHTFAHAQDPAVGLSDRGAGVLLVRRPWPSDHLIRAYRFRRGAGWSRPTRLGVSVHLDLQPYSLAVDGRGRAVAAWTHDDRRPVVQARIMRPHGAWGPVRALSRPGTIRSETVLVSMHGRADVVWTSRHRAITWASKAPGRRWRTVAAYPRGTGDVRALATNGRGDLGLLWQHWTTDAELYAGLHAAALGWTAGQRVPAQFEYPSAYGALAMPPDGSLIVLTHDVTRTDPTTAQVSVIARRLTRP